MTESTSPMHGEPQGATAPVQDVDTGQVRCQACPALFKPRKKWQRFCSAKCRNGFHTAEERKERIRQASAEMFTALRIIAKHSCERSTAGPGSCWSHPEWTREAEFSADRWCAPCIALAAIHDLKPAEPMALPKAP